MTASLRDPFRIRDAVWFFLIADADLQSAGDRCGVQAAFERFWKNKQKTNGGYENHRWLVAGEGFEGRPSGYEFVVRHLRAWWREKWKSKFYRAVSEFPFWRKILSLCYAWASALLDRFSAIGKVHRSPSDILFLVCNEEECLRSSSDAFLLAWWVQYDWKGSSISVRHSLFDLHNWLAGVPWGTPANQC